jgi:aryl-alcohol dehydrogenase-like predicted oxidoreductase
MREPEELVFPFAQEHGTGVVIMKTTYTDKMLQPDDAPPPEAFYRYVLAHPAVNVALMGLRDLDRFRRVARALAVSVTQTAEERSQLEAYGARLREAGKLKD